MKYRIFNECENIYDAVQAFLNDGFVILSGTTTPAVYYADRLINCLEPYTNTSPQIGYQNVPYNGYFFYVVDRNRFDTYNERFKELIDNIDRFLKNG